MHYTFETELIDERSVTVTYDLIPADPGCNDISSNMFRPPSCAESELLNVIYDGIDIFDDLSIDDIDYLDRHLLISLEDDKEHEF